MTDHYSITRRIEIDAAHRVPHHNSKCFNLHGHRYVIEATCIGPVISGGEQQGMVMDFSFLKECMMEVIHNPCDHATILWHRDALLESLPIYGANVPQPADPTPWEVHSGNGWKIYGMDEVPTAENLAKHWYDRLGWEIKGWFDQNSPELESPILHCVDVWETPNCRARFPS